VDGKFKGLSNKPLHVRFGHFLHELWHFICFPFNEGMLLAIAIAAESTQNYQFYRICPKTISLGNFEIPPKIEILMLFKKNFHV
jgi:hypothetical protein